MSFSVTALNLVNRVHRRRRMPDVGAFTETEDLATLDSVNAAIEEVLSSKRWEFDMRRGQMTLRPKLGDLTVSTNAGDANVLIVYRPDGLENEDTYGDYVVRILPSGASSYGNTAFRTTTANAILAGTVAAFRCPAEVRETLVDVDGSVFYAEYILPDEVRDIIRVTHHEEDLSLNQIDPVVEFDELYPQPSVEFGPPRVISVGGLDRATYLSTADEPAPGLRMIVWPPPDQAYVLDYTYHYRHPALEETTDTLDGVPPNVVDQIVDMAAADMKAYFEKDYDALRLRAFTQSKIDRMHSEDGGMYADRKPVGNWSGTAGGFRSGLSVTQGRLIGGG